MRFGASYMTVWFWLVPIVILFYVWSWRKREEKNSEDIIKRVFEEIEVP